MGNCDPQAILNREISATTLAVVVLTTASLLSLCVFFFLAYNDIVRKVLGTSVLGFVVFGAFGVSKLRDLITLRRLGADLFAQEPANPCWIKLSCRQRKATHAIGVDIAVPPGATSITIEFGMGMDASVSRKLGTKFAASFLPALFVQRSQWLALLRQ